ncbi:MAG: EAL domain-containing protein [Eubacteriales bacterium]|nr:EAL domain-containing protein [Eubacteriales bacterium]
MDKNTIQSLIQTGAFELYGQPKWTFGKNTCNTYEVFAEKLRLPEGETVSARPALELIRQDEALTTLFSRWFLEAAMRSAMDLTRQTDCNVTLSIGLLPLFANRADFADMVEEQLRLTGLPPAKLQFELSQAQRLTADGVANLNRLHDELRVGLLLNHFGTGLSNVDLLCDVHFDGIELDRSFAARVPQSEQACRVVVGVTHLADTLDLCVCAKGIETDEQFEFFEELNCFKGQGYLIGKPMPLPELRGYIAQYAVKRGHK